MGRGDKRTKRGKIFKGSFGISRTQRATTRKSRAVNNNVAKAEVKA